MTDTITPEVGKTYLTRDGRKARCICTDKRNDHYPVVCLVDANGSEAIEVYTADGRFRLRQTVSNYDLVSEAPRVVTVESVRADERERLAPHLHTAIAVITEMLEREGISDPETFPPLVEIRAAWLRSQKNTTHDQ